MYILYGLLSSSIFKNTTRTFPGQNLSLNFEKETIRLCAEPRLLGPDFIFILITKKLLPPPQKKVVMLFITGCWTTAENK
jgi:hypothetical protein